MVTKTEVAIYKGLAITAAVGIVGAIFSPVYCTIGSGSPKTACLSNMKQLGTSIAIYMADHDDLLPVRGGPNPTAVGWGERIYPYVKSKDVFVDGVETKDLPDAERERPRVSYALNANAVALPKASYESEIAGRSVLLYEIAGARTGRGGELHATLRLSPAGDGAAGGLLDTTDPEIETLAVPATGPLANSGLDPKVEARHGGVSTFAFLDTHVRALRPEAVSAGANARNPLAQAERTGCRRPDLPGRDRPCAAGTRTIESWRTSAATFSLN